MSPSASSSSPEARPQAPRSGRPSSPRVIVIGTGFGGIAMGVRLKRAGIESFTIYEKAGSIGGTWRDNDYPGAACDVPSHLYSFSFEQNPAWSRSYAPQAEIRRYLDHCADTYGVRRHIRFDTEVTSARFDERTSLWTVTLGTGEVARAEFVVTASGGLSRPATPDIPGLSTFRGKLFHSARWDHSYDLAGKTVGVVGTGASSIQFVPKIAPLVAALHLFQRTPPWVLPKADRAISPITRALYAALPLLQRLHRLLIYWMLEARVIGFAVYPAVMQLPQRLAVRFLRASIPDPVLRAKLTPSYTIGCKRILLSNDYYPALCRSNVEVVDTGIREVTADGVLTKDGTHRKLDALILGTGFEASESAAPFPIAGRGGIQLAERWNDGAEAYLGTSVSGFPNFFTIVGPNSGLGHSSMVFMIEAQVEHVVQAITTATRRSALSVEVRESVLRAYNDELQARLGRSVWASGCSSWYRTRTGRNTTLWPSFTFTFRNLTRHVRDADYVFSPAVEQREASVLPVSTARSGAPG